MKVTTIGIDLAKDVFGLHGVDREGRVTFKEATGSQPTAGVPEPAAAVFSGPGKPAAAHTIGRARSNV